MSCVHHKCRKAWKPPAVFKRTHLGNSFWVWLKSVIWLWDLKDEFFCEFYGRLQQNKKWNIFLNTTNHKFWWQLEKKPVLTILSNGGLFRWCNTQIVDSFLNGAVLMVQDWRRVVFFWDFYRMSPIRYLFSFSGNLLYGKKVILLFCFALYINSVRN